MSTPSMTFSTLNTASRTLVFNPTEPTDPKDYTVKLTATIPQPVTGNLAATKFVTVTFKLTVTNDCAFTSLIDTELNDMTVLVSKWSE